MKLEGKCKTTAMGILPHKDSSEAIKLALTLDIPFWPQLPKVNFYEDMYVQVTENFPGITVDQRQEKINFDLDNFYVGLEEYVQNIDNDDYFRLSPQYSGVFRDFLDRDLSSYYAVRGQSIGPISFGMKLVDSDKKPIIYNDEVKGFIYDFIAKKINSQYEELRKKNTNAFVWIDEPGLEIIFGSFTGYSSEKAKKDLAGFLDQIKGPKGIHLCGNPDWSFLLDQPLDVLSLDVFSCGHIFTKYVDQIKQFLNRGGIISWGIVPTLTEEFCKEDTNTLIMKLELMWDFLASRGIDKEIIFDQAWFAPARCCLVNNDEVVTVERSFRVLKELSDYFKGKYLPNKYT